MREKMACFELCVSPVLTQNEDIWNVRGSLTLNKGKLIRYFRRSWHAIVSNMTHVFILLGMGEKIPLVLQNTIFCVAKYPFSHFKNLSFPSFTKYSFAYFPNYRLSYFLKYNSACSAKYGFAHFVNYSFACFTNHSFSHFKIYRFFLLCKIQFSH